MSRIVKIDAIVVDSKVIDSAAEILAGGGAVVIPTETQYGLALRADGADAAERLGRIKKRRRAQTAALFVKNIPMAERFCKFGPAARRLAETFLPGPLTLVLPGRPGQTAVSPAFCSPDGFGIRISSSPVVAALMDKVDFAVTATSANISGRMTPPTIEEIVRDLGDAVALFIDGGPCRGVIPSTVVKATDEVSVLRPGLISEREIMAVLGKEK